MSDEIISTPLTPELGCASIKASLPFYTGVLGFRILYERPESGFAMIERQGSCIMLDEFRPGVKRSWLAGPAEAPFGRGMNLQMETKEVDTLYADVQKAGAKIFLPIEERWYRADNVFFGSRQFIVQDPDGYLLRFFQDLGERTAKPGETDASY
jgi:catechol 2,3-dioxygenase-like lactoylglutathione lyase family enzyme